MELMRCKYCSYELIPEDFEKKEVGWKCSCGAAKEDFKPAKDFLDEAIDILSGYKEGTTSPEVIEHSCGCADPEQ
ncbi:MAG: hypothetical protein J4451_00120 [DPANN group archaeon]|nr:hypothetical protein [DPANN group archaeon]